MSAANSTIISPERAAARFLLQYYDIWGRYFPGLNKRAHWHVLFIARTGDNRGVSSRTIHRTLYGSYGTDIRTCIERIKDCECDDLIKVFDEANRPTAASPGCLIGPTPRLIERFDEHCRETIAEICAVAGGEVHRYHSATECNNGLIFDIYRFFNAYDRMWRNTSELVVKQKGLTPAYAEDAMDHLVTYQYWTIIMLLWTASTSGSDRTNPSALVIDEIISRIWDRLRLGHLAIKERVSNLVRWGFFTEQTIKKHKAVSLTRIAENAINNGLSATHPLLLELHQALVQHAPGSEDKVT